MAVGHDLGVLRHSLPDLLGRERHQLLQVEVSRAGDPALLRVAGRTYGSGVLLCAPYVEHHQAFLAEPATELVALDVAAAGARRSQGNAATSASSAATDDRTEARSSQAASAGKRSSSIPSRSRARPTHGR